ncbi:MAG: hypothetical protein ACK5OA_05615 [Acidovorax sp.]|jgi:hypothetical protein
MDHWYFLVLLNGGLQSILHATAVLNTQAQRAFATACGPREMCPTNGAESGLSSAWQTRILLIP